MEVYSKEGMSRAEQFDPRVIPRMGEEFEGQFLSELRPFTGEREKDDPDRREPPEALEDDSSSCGGERPRDLPFGTFIIED